MAEDNAVLTAHSPKVELVHNESGTTSSSIIGDSHSVSDVDHFVVVHLKSGSNFYPILESPDGSNRRYSNPYCKVILSSKSNSAPTQSIKTHVIPECDETDENGPKWNQYLKFRVEPNQYPDNIEIMAFDKSDDARTMDAEYGSFHIDLRKLFPSKNKGSSSSSSPKVTTESSNVYESEIELKMGSKINVRVVCIVESNTVQRAKMESLRKRNYQCHFEESPETIGWIDSNTVLFDKLCVLRTEGISICGDMNVFGVMIPPPSNYNVLHHFEIFQGLFGTEPGLMRMYYDKHCNIVYAVDEEKREDNLTLGGMDITDAVNILWRYQVLKDTVFDGQTEFNIYKSYILDPSPQKIAFSLVAVVLQLVLTVAIIYDLNQLYVEESLVSRCGSGSLYDNAVLAMSVLVFVFLSISTNRTTAQFRAFYEHIGVSYRVPWLLVICDFMSNVVVSIVITFISFFFLLTSESCTDLVLNAFALTFVNELDDAIAASFESDEDDMMAADLTAFLKSECAVPRVLKYEMRDMIPLLWSPFKVWHSIFIAAKAFIRIFVLQKHRKGLPKGRRK